MTTQESAQPELKRVIGPGLLLLFVVGDIIGTGVYALTGTVAGKIGGALWLPFLLAFAVAFLTAFSYLELVGKYPRAAGAALYANRAFKVQFLTFMVAFAVMSSGITSATSAAQAFGNTYLKKLMGDSLVIPTVWIAVGFIVLLAAINFRGVAESLWANVVLTAIELSGLLIIIVVGFYAIGSGQGDPGRLTEIDTTGQTPLIAISSATALAFFAMVGFEDSVNMAEECREPTRIFPKAMLVGMGIAAVIYVLVAITSSLLVPADELAGAKSDALLKVLSVGAPDFPLWVFALIGLLAVINSALINMLMASRLVYGMANERIIPRLFGAVHPLRRTPWVSIVFTSVIAIVLAATVDINLLGGTTSLLLLVVFTVVNVAVLVLRKEKVDHDHFKAPTALPVIGAIACAYLASPLSGRPVREYLIAAILLGVGVVLWGVNRLVVGRVQVDPEKLSA
ncbi:APC family permease [Actinokineospora globicatena]|uniref:APC family permease n=1 Tax=Actinokineospora globicatena TaxID=103729 RepID=UPI0020A4A1F1|nr:APC family permease [Actinokineospora globicatena]MCP2300747.1 amino acid/polyamine/organocation transporter, APC superfamily [Actinokineospora globicatena]GLW77628.1 amino acid permease [Actinokineospora globicatena]GLW84464.1 amino acid permease [Actinokineospora globicatena]